MRSPRFALLMFLTASLFSCKKYIQQQEQKEAISIITNGVWYVKQYLQNDSDVTVSFSGYLFKFDANGIVTGTKDSISVTGLWTPDIAARKVTAFFPTAGTPVNKLNESWMITDSYTDLVIANSTDTINHTFNNLSLQKQ